MNNVTRLPVAKGNSREWWFTADWRKPAVAMLIRGRSGEPQGDIDVFVNSDTGAVLGVRIFDGDPDLRARLAAETARADKAEGERDQNQRTLDIALRTIEIQRAVTDACEPARALAMEDHTVDLAQQLADMDRERDALREALKPFAITGYSPEHYDDADKMMVEYNPDDRDFTVGDLRRAAALTKGGA